MWAVQRAKDPVGDVADSEEAPAEGVTEAQLSRGCECELRAGQSGAAVAVCTTCQSQRVQHSVIVQSRGASFPSAQSLQHLQFWEVLELILLWLDAAF